MVPVEKLSNNNFLNIYYIALEIRQELEIAPDYKEFIDIKKAYIYNPSQPYYPYFFEKRFQTVSYLSNIGEIGLYQVSGKSINIKLESQELFFLFCNKLAKLYNDKFSKQKNNEEEIDDLTEEQARKIKQEENISKDETNKVKSILLITPSYANFDFFWIIFNHNYEKKHKVSMVNKQTKNRDGVGNNLWQLCEEKKVDFDPIFLNYMNDKIFKVNIFRDFQKTKLVQIKNNKILINSGIILEKKSKELLDNEISKYFS